MDENKKDRLAYYLFNFFIGFYIANGTTILFARQLGFSFSRIFVLTAVYMLMFVIFEIPTGAFADLAGRKKSIILGTIALALAALASGSSQNYTQLFLSFFIWSLGFSLMSGSAEAMLYDKLGDEQTFQRVYGKAQSLFLVGTALAGILGPFLYSQNFRFPYLFSAVPFALAGLAIKFFREKEAQRPGFTLRSHFEQIKTGTRLAFHNRYVLWSMAVLSLCFAVAYTFSNSYQPYLTQIGYSVKAFSVILPVMFLAEAFGGAGSARVRRMFGENGSFWLNILLVGLALAVLGFFARKEILPVILLYSFAQGVLRPLVSTYANRYIDSTHRATVMSVQMMIGTITAAGFLFLFGFLTDKLGVIKISALMGGIVLAVGILLLLVKPKNSTEQEAG